VMVFDDVVSLDSPINESTTRSAPAYRTEVRRRAIQRPRPR